MSADNDRPSDDKEWIEILEHRIAVLDARVDELRKMNRMYISCLASGAGMKKREEDK